VVQAGGAMREDGKAECGLGEPGHDGEDAHAGSEERADDDDGVGLHVDVDGQHGDRDPGSGGEDEGSKRYRQELAAGEGGALGSREGRGKCGGMGHGDVWSSSNVRLFFECSLRDCTYYAAGGQRMGEGKRYGLNGNSPDLGSGLLRKLPGFPRPG
jgi:hypothetical protein